MRIPITGCCREDISLANPDDTSNEHAKIIPHILANNQQIKCKTSSYRRSRLPRLSFGMVLSKDD